MRKRRTAEGSALSQRIQIEFGNRLKAARKGNAERRINQAELASALGVTRTSISNIERGRHRVFLDQVYVAAHQLGVEVLDLLPDMNQVFRDTLSTGQAMKPEAARDVSAMVGSLRERALREVHEGEALAFPPRRFKQAK